MSNSTIRNEVEEWLLSDYLPEVFNQPFERRRVNLVTGGDYQFSAVSQDERIVGCISTSEALTSSGKLGVGKLQKIRADMLFLTLLKSCDKRLVVLTEQSMYDRMMKESEAGRVPSSIDFILAEIPAALRTRLAAAQREASDEMRPVATKRQS